MKVILSARKLILALASRTLYTAFYEGKLFFLHCLLIVLNQVPRSAEIMKNEKMYERRVRAVYIKCGEMGKLYWFMSPL